METRVAELRAQLRDGREALDAFVLQHGRTGDYEQFAAAVQGLEQKLHEVEARATPPPLREPEDELALALADFQAFGEEAQRQTMPSRQWAPSETPGGSGVATAGLGDRASVAQLESTIPTRTAVPLTPVSRANTATSVGDTARGRGSARRRKSANPSSSRTTRSAHQAKSSQPGVMHRRKASRRQKALAGLVAPDRATRDDLFVRMDYNGNGALSLAEIDKAIVEIWPAFDHKPALMRAYKAADLDQNGWVSRREFSRLLEYLVYFNNLWHIFEEIDSSGDRRLSLEEFAAACVAVGERLTDAEVVAEFGHIDTNGGGYVLFDEFCTWCAQRQVTELAAGPRPGLQSGPGMQFVNDTKGIAATARAHATRKHLPNSPEEMHRRAKKQHADDRVVPRATSRTVRWGSVEVSPNPPPSHTRSRAGIDLVMADTDALVRSFELSMRQSVRPVSTEPVTHSADMLNSVANGYTQQSEYTAAQGTTLTVPVTAASERFYRLLSMHRQDRQWQSARSYRFETATKVANERCVQLEGLVTETMTMADLGTLRFNTRRKLTDAMNYFVFELRLRVKLTAFLGWIWVVSRKQRDRHVVDLLRTQIAMTRLVDAVQAWKARAAETRRMRAIESKLERNLGAIRVSRVWWAWWNVVVHMRKCTRISSRSVLRSRLRQWHSAVALMEDKRREFMIAKALMARQRLAIAMESWMQACIVSQRQTGMISRVRRAILHLALSRWAHSARATHELWTQLERSILKNVAVRLRNRRLARCFNGFYSWFVTKSRRKLILHRINVKHALKASEVCASSFYVWLDFVCQMRTASTERCRLVGRFSTYSRDKKVLTRCVALWRLHASTSATATVVAQQAAEAAEAATAMHNQAIMHLREQLQMESSLQLRRVTEELAAAADAAANSAQAKLETEAQARMQAEVEATQAKAAAAASEASAAETSARANLLVAAERDAAQKRIDDAQAAARRQAAMDIAEAQEARRVAEREKAELQEQIETELMSATRATAEVASTFEALVCIEHQHAEAIAQHQLHAEQLEAELKRRSPLPIEEVEEAVLSHERLQAEKEVRVQAESQPHASHEQLQFEMQARARAEAEAIRANAVVEQLQAELHSLTVKETSKFNQAVMRRVEVLHARSQRRWLRHVFETVRDWYATRIELRQRVFTARRKLVRGCVRRAYSAWKHTFLVVSAHSSAEGGDAWFDKLPAAPMAHMDLQGADTGNYMEPMYLEEHIVHIQAVCRGYLVRKGRRKNAKLSAARLKTFLHGCGLARHWPTAVRHNLTVGALLELRDDQMKSLGWTAADRRKLSKGLRLERASLQRWVDSQEQSESSADSVRAAARPSESFTSMATTESQGSVRSPVLDALSTEAAQLRSQLQALHLQEQMEQTRLSTWHAPTMHPVPEGTPPKSARIATVGKSSVVKSPASVGSHTATSPTVRENYHPARDFHLLLTAMAGGADSRKLFFGQRSVNVFAGSVGELLQEISVALSHQGISTPGSVELLYADRRAGGNLVVLTNIADLPSRASVVLNPVAEDSLRDISMDEEEQLPNSLLAFVAQSDDTCHEEEIGDLPNSLVAFNREHSPGSQRHSPARTPVMSATASQSPARTPGSTVGLTPARRLDRIDALIDMVDGNGEA